jgi:plastocyanin
MNQSTVRLASTLVLALALASACGGDPPPQRTPPPDAKRVDHSKTGRISGRVGVDGPVPANPVAKISDPVCARAHASGLSLEHLVAENGGLNNVFVYVKDGLGTYYFESPADPVKLDQQGCRYTPHVFGVQVGQPIEIANSDPTVHNVSAVTEVNRGFNFTQAVKGLKNTTSFAAPEVMVRFKCDVHEWMSAYVGVVNHPYFAVTADGGRFELKDVPAGTYTVEAWHEKLGRQTHSVTLAEHDAKEVSFTFRAGAGD